ERADFLNAKKYKALRYKAEGTDLVVELAENHLWVSGGSVNAAGTPFVANMPTEEVFTAPKKDGVNGVVKSTKPLSYGGNLIKDFSLTFENGRIVKLEAAQGQAVLQRLVDTDEG